MLKRVNPKGNETGRLTKKRLKTNGLSKCLFHPNASNTTTCDLKIYFMASSREYLPMHDNLSKRKIRA